MSRILNSRLLNLSALGLMAAAAAFADTRVYWTDRGRGTIERARLDGSQRESIFVGGQPVGVALDPNAGHVYWTDGAPGAGRIRRANLDGSGIVDLITTDVIDPSDIELDLAAGAVPRMYWTQTIAGQIWQAYLDGSSRELLYVWDAVLPVGLALEPGISRMYWTVPSSHSIWRGWVHGGAANALPIENLNEPIDIDAGGGKLYWADAGGGRISRSNGDGTNVEVLFAADAIAPWGLALDLCRNTVYWTDPQTHRVFRLKLGQSDFETLADSDVVVPGYLALDLSDGLAIPGDLDCDGVVDFDDIDPFVLALGDPSAYAAQYPDCLLLNADCDGDGAVDFDDVNAFVELLTGRGWARDRSPRDVQYYVIRLSAPPGASYAFPEGINADGRVAGTFRVSDQHHAFFWNGCQPQELDSLGYPLALAYDINAAGQVAGLAGDPNEGVIHAILWTAGVAQDLGALPGGAGAAVYGVNNLGHAVGAAGTAEGYGHACLWVDGRGWRDLGTLGGPELSSLAWAVNDSDQVVGMAHNALDETRGFFWQNDSMVALATLGGAYCEAYDINQAGLVVGVADDGLQYHACLWTDGAPQDLGTLGGSYSYARAINNQNQIVGESKTTNGATHACLWQQGTVTDLNDLVSLPPEDYIIRANDVSDTGRIVASAVLGWVGSTVVLVPLNQPTPADMNCDGCVDFGDINPFIDALSDPAFYLQQYPSCHLLNADCNHDGNVDFGDINAFVELLSGA